MRSMKTRSEALKESKVKSSETKEQDLQSPIEKESLESRVERMFTSKEDDSDSDSSSNVIPPSTQTRPHSVFEEKNVNVLLRLCKDMTSHAPISKPEINERLPKDAEGTEVLQKMTINQIINRLKYERKRSQDRIVSIAHKKKRL